MMTPEQFTDQARQALQERLRCVVLFGSYAAGDFVEGVSQYDLLVVAEPLGLVELESLAPVIRPWRKAGNPLPLLFTPTQLAASTDAFAIELLDMQDARRVLYGEDPVAGLKIELAHVRHHLERELRGKSLLLRDRFVLAAGDDRMIAKLLTDSLSTFLALFRTALRLLQPAEQPVPPHKLDALRTLAERIGLDPQPLLAIHDLKVGRAKTAGQGTKSLCVQYWQAIEVVTQAIDRQRNPSA